MITPLKSHQKTSFAHKACHLGLTKSASGSFFRHQFIIKARKKHHMSYIVKEYRDCMLCRMKQIVFPQENRMLYWDTKFCLNIQKTILLPFPKHNIASDRHNSLVMAQDFYLWDDTVTVQVANSYLNIKSQDSALYDKYCSVDGPWSV